MKALSGLGRFIYAIPFILFGAFHFMNAASMAGMVPSFLPFADFWVYLTGIALIAAGVAIIINKYARTATLLLALMLLIFILTIHVPNMSNSQSMAALLKDMALMGAALTYSGILSK